MDQAITTAHKNRAPGSAMADTDIDLADMVTRIPDGLGGGGVDTDSGGKSPLRGLILDGVEPTIEAMENHRYPYAKPLFIVTRADAPASVRAILDFLRSVERRAILLQLGISVAQPTP